MALIKCPDCNKEISDTSKRCIHCGCKIRKKGYEKKIKEKDELRLNTKNKIVICIFAIVCVMLAGIFAIVKYIDNCVPNLFGSNLEEAKVILNEKNIPYEVIYEYTEDYDKDVIYGQNLRAGALYNSEEKFVLNVSSGKIYIVPDIIGKEIKNVSELLEKIPHELVYEYHMTYEDGYIIDLSDKVGTTLTEDKVLEVKVSRGTYTVFEDFKGKTVQETKQILYGMGAKLVNIEEQLTSKYEKDVVYDFVPKKYGDISETVVTLKVSSGIGIEIDDLVGQSEEILKTKKYADKISIKYVYDDLTDADLDSDDTNDGVITKQSVKGLVAEDKLDKVVFEISKPAIKITRMLVESNYVGGIDTTINFTNLTKKEIAYITFTVKYYDRMGYPAVCRIKDVSTMSMNYTGPFKAGASESALWEAVIYHAPTAAIKPLSAEVIFTDGEVQNLEYGRWYWRMPDYYGGELHD